MRSRRIEQAGELALVIVADLAGPERALALAQQQERVGRHPHDFVGRDEPPRRDMRADAFRRAGAIVAPARAPRRADEQNRWLAWTAIGGVVAGIVLWIVFGGMIVRATPDRWQWPESMATRTLGGTTWEGARRLAAASYPDTWNAMVVGTVIGQGNQGALERCQQAADKAGATVRCTVRIRPAERK